jgi:glucokinase
VGGGIILNGEVYRGATGSAGEVGHLNISEKGPLCNCGNRGCLETYVGGPHIVEKVRQALEGGQKSSLQEVFQKDPDQLTPYAICLAAQKGDPFAVSIWDEVGRVLGLALGDLIYLFNPERIYFTGGVAQAKDLILKPMWRKLQERAFKTPVNAVKIFVAEKAAHIGVIGASLL